MKTSNLYEIECWSKKELCIGLDEAGRGPLAGPLVVAGVVFPIGYDSKDIYDSKKVSEKRRKELFSEIITDALFFDFRIVTPKEIDELNIYQATKKAMAEIANQYEVSVVLTDAMPLDIKSEVISLVKGDQKSCSIAAASIIAKVLRDMLMDTYDCVYPEYGFSKHKGYPTKMHLEALQKHGAVPIHRKSYGPVASLNQIILDF